jgi:hypothetical protein
MAKAGKKHSTSGESPPEANPHFLGRFTPTRLAASPLYRAQHSGPMTLTPAEARQARSLLTKASLSIPEGLPPPSKRGQKKKPPKDLRELELYLQSAKRSDLPLAAHLHGWITKTPEGGRFRGARTVKAAVAELQRELRKPR